MSQTDYSGDYLTGRRKVSQGTDWRGTVNVSLGDDTVSWGHRLLNESEFFEVKQIISLSEFEDYKDEDQPDAQERLLELQEKEELTDEEEAELQDLSREMAAETDKIEDALGDDAYDKLMWAGKQAVMPTDEDLEDLVFNAPKEIQSEILGDVPQHLSPDDPKVEEALKRDMVQTISQQPFPIKLNLGMQAFMETIRVMGNGLNPEE